jgi:hypothetical protein
MRRLKTSSVSGHRAKNKEDSRSVMAQSGEGLPVDGA